ncbi:cytochrome c peroxidase [Mucilaginibacter sabulilitoris]|uniref:Cytochrome c peroxidase n=1 Tax=Mucilaginibacter sabulilitoris TaxID=1173583 RepID=A0ABZ0TNU6_9SPHI|nr:cytochrome c peroxidase [Mucilaginibacter sabulilitoris]WPU93185.1 cytochrome c peroxidase [Mucilaginibacter sabulilitoris]
MRKKTVIFLGVFSLLAMLISATASYKEDVGATATIETFRKNALSFTTSVTELNAAIKAIDKDKLSITQARKCLLNCRLSYKNIAFFTSYFFPSETKLYNAPPKYEVEEPELELEEPMGLQQIEALLFDADVVAHKPELLAQTDALYTSAKDLPSLLYQFKADDRQILESLRLELIRMAALYISGYDAPSLKSGITEALQASRALQVTLQPYCLSGNQAGHLLAQTLNNSIVYLSAHQNFDAFDRMAYLTRFNLPLQQQLGALIQSLHLELNTTAYLNYGAGNMFRPGFLNRWDSIPPVQRKDLAALGKRLFFDRSLSGNQQVSCSTCHRPEQYFTDGKFRSPAMMRDSILKRNTPTLLYAGFQHMQFWDGRAPDMVTQIKTVLFNPLEMGSSPAALQKHVWQNPGYSAELKKLAQADLVAQDKTGLLARAISAYVGTFAPLNSPFDRYLAGERKAMSPAQIKGFNLFMGKAQCGTCHFVPYFNSLVPPLYDVSETEILGTPKTDQLIKPAADSDPGRYDLYAIRYYRQAFKTPTVRNAQMTAPYMHNGTFKTLKSVLDFYNKGGGNGIGLQTEEQTLPAQPLKLSDREMDQITSFINSLTDKPVKRRSSNTAKTS